MSHDGDKLIRQLSLVAYLMAERRPVTARDVEERGRGLLRDVRRGLRAALLRGPDRAARARRRRITLAARRVHRRGALHARSARPTSCRRCTLNDAELAALADVPVPARGAVRLRRAAAPGAAEPRARPPEPDRAAGDSGGHAAAWPAAATRPRSPQRLAKLETAISKQRTIVFRYFAMTPRRRGDAHGRPVQPVLRRAASGTSSAATTTATTCASSASRASAATCASRPAASATSAFPEDFDPGAYRDRAPWQLGERGRRGRARRRARARPGWSSALFGRARHGRDPRPTARRTLHHALRRPRAAGARGCSAMDGHALPARRRPSWSTRSRRRSSASRAAHEGDAAAASPRRSSSCASADDAAPRGAPSPVAPERFAVLQAMLADLLEAAATRRAASSSRGRAAASATAHRRRSSQEQLNLLNLVNFGGGCYAVYAEIQDGRHDPASRRSCTARSSAGRRGSRRSRPRRS